MTVDPINLNGWTAQIERRIEGLSWVVGSGRGRASLIGEDGFTHCRRKTWSYKELPIGMVTGWNGIGVHGFVKSKEMGRTLCSLAQLGSTAA